MDSPRPLLDAELQFFIKGTGKGKFQDKLSHEIFSKLHTGFCPCSFPIN